MKGPPSIQYNENSLYETPLHKVSDKLETRKIKVIYLDRLKNQNDFGLLGRKKH